MAERAVPKEQHPIQMVPPNSLLGAQGDLQQRGPDDADAPAAEEQRKDDTIGDKGGKKSAEEADCFPEIGQTEEGSSQPNAKKPAAAKAECTVTAPEQDSLLKAEGDLEQREDTLEATVQQTVQATLAVQAILGETSSKSNSSSSSSVASGPAEQRG